VKGSSSSTYSFSIGKLLLRLLWDLPENLGSRCDISLEIEVVEEAVLLCVFPKVHVI
jgi:hypothetical protein